MLLWKTLAQECASRCHTSATLDCKTVQGRVEHEGLSFLTITLPTFGKDFERSLDRGWVDRDLFTGFQWKGGLPKLLWGFLDQVFDRTSGVLLDDPDVDCIRSVRQLTLFCSKMRLPCSPVRVDAAFRAYVQCEQEVRENRLDLESTKLWQFRQASRLLYQVPLTKVDRDIYYLDDVIPKHGPGATAEKLTSNGKYRLKTWTKRLEKIFPCGEFLLPNWRHWRELEDVDILEPGDEIPVRVISVPKTLKTPRIIGIEPTAMQYAQQAILPKLLEGLFEVNHLRSFIGIDDQDPNREMAKEGSSKGNLATLDLSEASDRVSNQLVCTMLCDHPHLFEAVQAARSWKADVPGEGVIALSKFASMGSALCFPIEAMVFLSIVFVGIQKSLRTQLTPKLIESFRGKVRVYGDDIIVPVDHVSSVIEALEAYGLKVNSNKSFWTGRFRESCGKEYYAGDDVSVVKCRSMLPNSRRHAQEAISTVELRNQLYKAGYWATCRWLDDRLKEVLIHYPRVADSSPVLGRHSFLGYETQRIGEHLQNPLVRGYVVSAKSPSDKLDGIAALLKCLLRSTRASMVERPDNSPRLDHLDPLVAEEHLERAGRPHAVNIKLRWSPPF